MSTLRYLPNAGIQRDKWDRCVQQSDNGLVYASSIFLDHLAHHWDGIVIGDYEYIMPVPWKSKFGIKYVTPPVFTQQMGLIGPSIPSAEMLNDVIRLLRQKFKYGEYFFNYSNEITGRPKNNFILSLAAGYDEIYNNYQPDLKYDLRKAAGAGLTIREDLDHPVISLYRELYHERFPKVGDNDYRNLSLLFADLLRKGDVHQIPRLAYDENGKLIAGILCATDDKRVYLLLTASTPEGRKRRSIHYLIDNVIRSRAGTGLFFDFEGSDIPGIAHFFQSFGSVNQPYTEYRWNDLPFPLNLLKK